MARKFKFPTPSSCKLKDRAVLCTAERMLIIYNQFTVSDAQRITKKIKIWFSSEAKKHGWSGTNFLPEVSSGHSGGCILFIPPQQVNVTVNVTNTTLILNSEDGDD
ncbi:MAG: hypothetical protein DID92_2727743408 [Candidatus Nitrotoga sp. SPKER]|nr:MAG: hypothetical protein DID92_2727743408 [Candidatus Nitrotoga sp. SPKER]